MRGMIERGFLVCPACGNRLAEMKDGAPLWGRSWADPGDGHLVSRRRKYWPMQGADDQWMGYRYPGATTATCQGRSGASCGEDVELPT